MDERERHAHRTRNAQLAAIIKINPYRDTTLGRRRTWGCPHTTPVHVVSSALVRKAVPTGRGILAPEMGCATPNPLQLLATTPDP